MMASATPIVDLDGQWVEEAFRHLDDRNYRKRLYRLLRKHGHHTILRIIMVTVKMIGSQKLTGANNPAKRPESRAKISAALTERWKNPENRAMMTAAKTGKNNPNFGKIPTLETKAKLSAAGFKRFKDPKNHPFFGKTLTEKHKTKISETLIGRIFTEDHKAKIGAAAAGKTPTEEAKAKMRASWTPERKAKLSISTTERWNDLEYRTNHIGKNHPMFGKTGENSANWKGGRSFEPYCPKFNEPLRERYRNHYGRVCVLSDILRSVMGPESGLDNFDGHEIFSGRRLSVHHIYGNKMAGCDGTELALVPLQGRYNSMKFDGLKLDNHPFYITLFMLKDQEKGHF